MIVSIIHVAILINRPVRAAAAAAVGAVQRARGAASSAAALPVLRALAQDRGATEVQVIIIFCF